MERVDCLDENLILDLLAGALPAETAARVQRHADECPACYALLVETTAAQVPAGASAADEPRHPSSEVPSADAPARSFSPPASFDEYRVMGPLGQGAMGQVYLCQDTALDRLVAIKFVDAIGANDSLRFQVEARAVARLAHPNVVTLYRVGAVAGRPYLVSEFVRGRGLDRLDLPIPWQQARRIGLGLARGLAAAHGRGVLHRDIKPANVILTEEGEVKLLDFGLAKLMDTLPSPSSSDLLAQVRAAAPGLALAATSPDAALDAAATPTLTARGALVGTPLYMAPEAWRGEPPGPRVDIYALGAVLYQLVSGHPPNDRDALRDMRQAGGREPLPLAQAVPGVDGRFAAIVDRCLRRRPEDRFPSAQALCRALEELGAPSRGLSWKTWRRMAAGGLLLAALAAGVLRLGRHREGPLGPERTPDPPGPVLIPGGTFVMGSSAEEIEAAFLFCQRLAGDACDRSFYQREAPQRRVSVSSFLLDRTEVTNEHFAAWLNGLPGVSVGGGRLVRQGPVLLADLYPAYGYAGISYDGRRFAVRKGMERWPVVQVTWDAATRYCAGPGRRLPTEAEWEYAARGGSEERRFPWGETLPTCEGVVFSRVRWRTCQHMQSWLQDVGQAAQDRSLHGVHDLGGSVSEWVQDALRVPYAPCDPGPGGCQDPVAQASPIPRLPRVARGGSWNTPAESCRTSGRIQWQQDEVSGSIGFRCAGSSKEDGRAR